MGLLSLRDLCSCPCTSTLHISDNLGHIDSHGSVPEGTGAKQHTGASAILGCGGGCQDPILSYGSGMASGSFSWPKEDPQARC